PQQDVIFDKVNLAVGTPTPTFTPCNPSCTPTRTSTPTFTRTNTATPTCGPAGQQYVIQQSTGQAIVPGTVDIGNHTDDGTTAVLIPFTYTLYGQPFTTVNVSSNGNMQFSSSDIQWVNACLPAATLTDVISPHWDVLRAICTDSIYTSVS